MKYLGLDTSSKAIHIVILDDSENLIKIYKADCDTKKSFKDRFPELMDKANYALQLLAEGKLNLGHGNSKNLEIEQMKLKNFKNNLIIVSFGIVIIILLVF